MSLLCILMLAATADEAVAEPAPTNTPKAKKLAVMEARLGEGLEPAVGESIVSVLAAELALRGRGSYEVISRNDLRSLLKQQISAQQYGCGDPKCVADLGEAAAADEVLTTTISQVGLEWVFTVELVDVAKSAVLKRQAVAWKGPTQGLIELVRPLVARLMGGTEVENYLGQIELLTGENEATVHVDDRSVGATPIDTVRELPIGKHRVRVFKDGFLPHEEDVVVQHNETTLLQVRLVSEASLRPWYARAWFWGGAGAVLAGGIGLAYLLRDQPTTTVQIETPLP